MCFIELLGVSAKRLQVQIINKSFEIREGGFCNRIFTESSNGDLYISNQSSQPEWLAGPRQHSARCLRTDIPAHPKQAPYKFSVHTISFLKIPARIDYQKPTSPN